jgi:hypothetical protein
MNPVTNSFGDKFYYNNANELHRIDFPAIECSNGTTAWYINGKLHREDGPAIEFYMGRKEWRINGELHRINGPAIELANGEKYWYISGKQISCNSDEEFFRIVKMKALL